MPSSARPVPSPTRRSPLVRYARTVDAAFTTIVRSGRVAGTLVNAGNVERYTRMGVRVVMTSFFPWIQAGAKDLMDRAAAGARN